MNRYLFYAASALVAVSSGALSGCEKRRPNIMGIGDYFLGTTTLAQAVGGCEREAALTRCTHIRSLGIGKQKARATTYYRGHHDEAPLVEIILEIQRCDERKLLHTLQKKLGKPNEHKDKRAFWSNPSSFVVAQLPAEPTLCEINFILPSESKRIAYLKTGKTAAERAASDAKAPPPR